MAAVVHFEIHAQDPLRAQAFYSTLFAWGFSRWGEEDYWLVEAKPGESIGGLILRKGEPPKAGQAVNSFVSTVSVDDLDASLEMALKAGGDISVPRMPVPSVGWLAYVTDTEGNIFGMLQFDEAAAVVRRRRPDPGVRVVSGRQARPHRTRDDPRSKGDCDVVQ